MYINAGFFNTKIVQQDVNKLLPSLNLPVYKEYGALRFDTLNYAETPLF